MYMPNAEQTITFFDGRVKGFVQYHSIYRAGYLGYFLPEKIRDIA